ncbi:hypothetical protein BGW38_006051 [Lunasporangiospora selenospora]|uniref:Superoxide dismutase copper/zinc binding domain-containing protein n=1 Tax=Lunasporangiospora selenospora TaxID=979761 RepID=A0A9P6FNC8_9FUNG|nr:hypothetical protein BGW38_006051 [Lunasporangiospora selenospora]
MGGYKAKFEFKAPSKGTGAHVTISDTKGFSTEAAVLKDVGFEYHIHVKPVGPNNDCAATGGHLDPTKKGMAKCNRQKPDECQEGDLSGKHGNLIPTESGSLETVTYLDKSLHLDTTDPETTIVGRSVVIHNNGARIACADILPAGTSPLSAANLDSSSMVQNQTQAIQTPASQPNYGSHLVPTGHIAMMASGIVAVAATFVISF